MIKYTLKCAHDHSFDSWFQSGEAFAKLQSAGLVGCPVCGAIDVQKAIMAPRIRAARGKKSTPPSAPAEMHALSALQSQAEAAIKEFRQKIQKTSEYVGRDFATQARAIHAGEAPERSIYGEAEASEARQLLEDGVPVAPLPFMPTRKTN